MWKFIESEKTLQCTKNAPIKTIEEMIFIEALDFWKHDRLQKFSKLL